MPGYLWDDRDPSDAPPDESNDDPDLYDLLMEVESYLDDRADTVDGSDGQPVANRAMALQARVRQAIKTVEVALKPPETPETPETHLAN